MGDFVDSKHSFHRAGAAHPHPPHRVRAPPHLEFGRSPSGCGVENDCQCEVKLNSTADVSVM